MAYEELPSVLVYVIPDPQARIAFQGHFNVAANTFSVIGADFKGASLPTREIRFNTLMHPIRKRANGGAIMVGDIVGGGGVNFESEDIAPTFIGIVIRRVGSSAVDSSTYRLHSP